MHRLVYHGDMSFFPSPLKVRSGYTGTPQHLKTLDILGRSKNFAKLSKDDLILYCELARSKHGCDTPSEASIFLEERYGWDINTRMRDIEDAWESLESGGVGDDNDRPVVQTSTLAKNTAGQTATATSSNEIPIVLKSGAFSRPVLICEVDDEALNFEGDSGAVGRIFCDPQSLRLDIKGRQYSAQITRGPTLMVLNLAAPVGQSAASGLCARAEVVTNEFCHLEFERDLHSSMQGVYTGNDDEDELMQRDSDADSDAEGVSKKRGKGASSKRGRGSSSAGAAADSAAQPKISTITQRKRKSTGGGGKKGSSAAKRSKS